MKHLLLKMYVIKTARKKLFWGITIDNKLNFDSHIRKICTKSSQNLNALSIITAFLNKDLNLVIVP